MTDLFKTADILLPKDTDMTKWSVVACDQFTSEREYWEEAESIVGDAPSTLNMIFPEIYIGEENGRIDKINSEMQKYLNNGLFKEYKDSLFLVKRQLKNGKVRWGLIGAVDLEEYSFEKGSESSIRATEGTVVERIPPRVKIRENAFLEFPHIMLLIDDPEKSVVEPTAAAEKNFEKIYDFELMLNGGHITGYNLPQKEKERIMSALTYNFSKKEFEKRYLLSEYPQLSIAVGDGNHSLATAKVCWENIKKTLSEEEKQNHPARFALAELVNLHDSSLEFEPIHRVVFDTEPEKMYTEFLNLSSVSEKDNGGKKVTCVFEDTEKDLWINDENSNLAVGSVQNFIDNYLKDSSGKVDYIHGENVVRDLSKGKNIGFLLPTMQKNELFKTVILDGALPRKTFSMGEACDKRYYIEGKKLR